MRKHPFLFVALAASLTFFAAPIVRAQIVGQVYASIHHSFIVGNATLPPGDYIFRMLPQSDLALMTVYTANGSTGAEFLVQQSTDSHTPRHTELFFDRYGNKEFLTHIYEQGDKFGVRVVEPSRIEARLQKQGVTPVEHTEEQK